MSDNEAAHVHLPLGTNHDGTQNYASQNTKASEYKEVGTAQRAMSC